LQHADTLHSSPDEYCPAVSMWFRDPPLRPGERVLWSAGANRDQGGRAVGGKLYVTAERLLFVANRMDHRMRGLDWEVGRDLVNGYGVANRSLARGPLSGGIRRRLRVTLADGTEGLFVVRRPDATAAALSALSVPPTSRGADTYPC
jgi:hypothetical protein